MLTRDGALRIAARRTSLTLWLATPPACVAVLGALAAWAWSPQLTVRRFAAALCVAVLLACVAGLLTARGSAQPADTAEAYAAVRPDGTAQGRRLPVQVPSGRAVVARGMAGAAVYLAALVGIWGLAGGEGRHAEQADGIRQAGARVVEAPVTQVRPSGDSGTRSVTVLLHSDGGPVTSTFATPAAEHVRPGGHLPVMYAPHSPQLGAVHGGMDELEHLMSGRAMTPGLTWGLGIAWVVLCGVALPLRAGGLRTVTGTRATRALRGSCTGPSGERVLTVRTGDGTEVPFRFRGSAHALARAVGDEEVWVCWKPPKGRAGTVPAVLVGDSGWALHGELRTRSAASLAAAAVDPAEEGRIDEQRTVKVWHPSAAWPLIMPSGALLCVVFALACAAVLVTALGVSWRWQLGAVGTLALAAAPLTWMRAMRAKGPAPAGDLSAREPVGVG